MHEDPMLALLEAFQGTMQCTCTKLSPVRAYGGEEFYFRLSDHAPVIPRTVTGFVYVNDQPVATFFPTPVEEVMFRRSGKPEFFPVSGEVEHASPHLCLVFNKPVEGEVTATVFYEYPRD